MKIATWIVVLLAVMAAARLWKPEPLRAEGGIFSSASSGRKNQQQSATSWKMPTLWPFASSQRAGSQRRSGPSTWERMNASVKRSWRRTTAALTPGSDQPSRRARSKQETGSAWNPINWFAAEEPHQPRNVREWMAQDRVGRERN